MFQEGRDTGRLKLVWRSGPIVVYSFQVMQTKGQTNGCDINLHLSVLDEDGNIQPVFDLCQFILVIAMSHDLTLY